MSNRPQSQAQFGVGLPGALFITFLVLKLCGVINWSWWWVTAPLWGGFALIVAIGLLLLCFGGFFALLGGAACRIVDKPKRRRS